jgi:hypothetical protein
MAGFGGLTTVPLGGSGDLTTVPMEIWILIRIHLQAAVGRADRLVGGGS